MGSTVIAAATTAMVFLGASYDAAAVPRTLDFESLKSGDSIPDAMDNCLIKANPDQRDTDGDGIGNAYDADIFIPNDCQVNFLDLGTMKAAFFSSPGALHWNPDADFDGNNQVNFLDLGVMKGQFFARPGPSGIANLCTP